MSPLSEIGLCRCLYKLRDRARTVTEAATSPYQEYKG